MTRWARHSRKRFLSGAAASLLVFAAHFASGQAQNSQPAAASTSAPVTAEFDVADIHPSPFARVPNLDGPNLLGDRYILYQATMTELIAVAYKLDPANVHGGPSWLDWNHYDIIAKAPPSTPRQNYSLMLQSLLANRFGLVVHQGTAPMPSYLLTAQAGKTRLKPSDGKGDFDCKGQPQPAGEPIDSAIACHNVTMPQFADMLRGWGGPYLSQPVVESTGLKGAYDFDLKWTSRGNLIRSGADAVSLFDALENQLGLKLTLGTAPRPVLTVDRVNESPAPNPPDLASRMPPLPPAQFEVATIRPSGPNPQRNNGACGDQVNLPNQTLKDLINSAWDLNQYDPDAIVGAPKWLDNDRFDIHAKLAGDAAASAPPDVCELPDDQMRQLMRTLIEERFQMKDHWEERPGTAYHLVADKPKLTPADPATRTRCYQGPGPDGKDPRLTNHVLNRLFTCQNITMAQFGAHLQSMVQGYIHGTVIDDTGLKGSYSFTLSFSGAGQLPGGVNASAAGADPNGAISLFDAVRNTLGVKLEKETRPVRVLVIDHIEEQPTAN